MDKNIRQEQWQRLIDLLEEADAVQQALLGEDHETACYEFHNQLNQLADDFTDFANEEECEIV